MEVLVFGKSEMEITNMSRLLL